MLYDDLNSSQTTGNLITVNASNVTIDFQGHYIAGPVNNNTQNTYGIRATEQSNIIIKNGTVAYCRYGIFLTGNSGSSTNAVGELIDGMHVTYCYYIGIGVEFCPASPHHQLPRFPRPVTAGRALPLPLTVPIPARRSQNNTVSSVTASTSYGVYTPNSFARQNTVSGAGIGVSGGKYQDNLTLSCTTPYINGTEAGGNN